MATDKKRLVACPQCKALSEYSTANKYRPFCSERCKLMDLGQWASENYRIPEQAKPEDLDSEYSDN
ncbi:MAG: DNA gyrase inhibitor YacG [Betaproteobacteria bacterium HGW-Betaproteobacteria-8]|nr:MAG: DNA gyrase inhibitor YacG [Betaproteobacteria bacterium HGW-Betaproteobacteria-8]